MNLALHGFLLHVILSMILDNQNGFGLCSAGEPGYLDFDNLPETNFSCQGKVIGGYYADVEAGCQMFHVCTIGQKDEIMDIKFLCLNGTVFDQETRVCERVDEVDCSKSEKFYNLNLELYGNSAVTLSLHEGEDDDLPPESLEEHQLRTSSARPISTTTTTSKPSQSSTTPSSTNYQHSTGYPQVYQPQSAFPSVQSNPPKSIYDDKNGGYHHQYIYHNDERNDNQATSYQLFSNQGVSSTTPTPHVHQVRYSSTPSRQIIHNEPSTVTPLFHTSSTIQTLLNNNANGPSIINPIFHNHGIGSTTEHYSVHNNNPRETSEYQDNDEEQDERDEHDDEHVEHIEHEERRRLEPLQSTNKGKVSKLSISPVPQQDQSRLVIQAKANSQTSQLHRISVNFLPTQSSIQTTSRTFYPTSRTSSKPQKTSSQRIMQQHIHVTPLPIIPNLNPRQVTINLSPPDIQKIVQNPPPLLPSQSRVIVTAKASVSDESGRPLNASELITLPLPTIPSSYDDYKEGDESFDPFYRDVPKIHSNQRIVVSSRSSRSPNRKIIFHRRKRDASENNSQHVQKFSQVKPNDTEVSSIVRNLRKLKNIFFATDFDDSDEPNYFNSEEIPTNFDLKNDNTDYLNDNVKLATKNSVGIEFTERDNRKINEDSRNGENGKTKTTKLSTIINPVVNTKNRETEYVDSNHRKDKINLETTASDVKNSENHKNQKNFTNDRLKSIKPSGVIEIAADEPKTLEIEYYDEEEHSNKNQEEKSIKTSDIKNTTEELDVEEYVYDPDELYFEEFYTTTKNTKLETTTTNNPKIVSTTTPKTELTSKYPTNITTKNSKINSTTTKPSKDETTTPSLKFDSSNNSSNKKMQDSSIISNYTKGKEILDLKPISGLDIAKNGSDVNISKSDKDESKSENLNKTKDTVSPNSALKKESEELLETKSSSNRKKSKSSESTQNSEEKFIKSKRPHYSEEQDEEEEIDVSNKPRRKNKYISDPDYLEDEDYDDYEEERRLERRKQNSKRRKTHSQSRSRLRDYDDDDNFSRSRSSSSRRPSSRGRKTDINRDRGKSYQNIRRRKKPISVESDSEELEYPSEDYNSEELKSTSVDDDWYEDELERKRNQKNKGRRNKGLRYDDPPRRSSSRRRNQSRKFRDEDIDYDSQEASTLSSGEDDDSWYYPTSKELPDDSRKEDDYTEDSRSLDDVTTSAEDLTTETSTEEETPSVEEITTSILEETSSAKNDIKDDITTKEVTKDEKPSIKDTSIQPDVFEVTEKELFETDPEEGKTEGVLKFTDELPQDERLDATTEVTIENPMKDHSPIKDMQDYVDDNYEPNNYKGTKKNKDISAGRNSTQVQQNKDLELGTKDTNSRTGEQNDKNLEETKVEVQETTTQAISTTSRSTRRGTRPTTKATARTTPPKLFKPLTGKRNYLYIPPTTTPLPVVIKRRISLVHPRPAKPPKSYNELAPKPVIRKKLLEARKSVIEVTLTSTTSEYEKEINLEPLATSEVSKSEIVTEDNLSTTSEAVLPQKEIEDNLESQKEDNSENDNSEIIPFDTDDKIDVENKIKKERIENEEKITNDEHEDEKTETEKQNLKEIDESERNDTTPLVENQTNYPYLLSRLSTTPSTKTKNEDATKRPEEMKKITNSPLHDTDTPVTTTTSKSLESKSTPSSNFEPKSESTKPEVTLLRTPTIQKTSKRTTKKEPPNLGGSYQGFNCLGKEMYRFYGDKRDCRLFHYCSPGFTSTQVLDFKFVCEQGTHFDESTQSCRHNYKNSECTVRIFW